MTPLEGQENAQFSAESPVCLRNDTENCGLQHIKSVNYSAIDPSLIDDEIENMVGDDYDGGEASANLTSSNSIVESEGLQQKAMGGTAVKDGEMPWAVAIFNKDEYICTGTLVSKKHVLTAAHCFFQKDHGCTFVVPKTVVKDFEVRYGGTCVKSEDPSCEGHDGLKSVKIVRAEYREFFLLHNCNDGFDFAMIELEFPIDETHICLPHLHNTTGLREKPTFWSYGWGSDPQKNLVVHPILQNLDVGPPLTRAYCKKLYSNLPDDVICAMEYNNKDMCSGDSGGGFVASLGKRFFLQGLVSFGTECARLVHEGFKPKAQVFTDVSYHTASIDRFVFGHKNVVDAVKDLIERWW